MRVQSQNDAFQRILQEFVDQPICEQTYRDLTLQTSLEDLIRALGNAETSHETSNLIVETLQKCIKLDSVQDELLNSEQLKFYLADASSSNQTKIRQLLANLLNLSCNRTKGIQFLLTSGNYSLTATLLFDENLDVSESAKSAILRSLTKDENACELFFDSPIFDFIVNSLNKCTDVVLVRVLSAFISIGKISETLFEKCEQKGLYDRLLRMYFGDDLLMKIITIDLIQELSNFPAGIEFLIKKEMPSNFLRELRKNTVDNSIKITILHFLSECVCKYPLLTQRIFEEDSKAFPGTLQNFLLSSEETIGATDKIRNLVCFASCWSTLCIHPIGREAVLKELPLANVKMAKFISSSFGAEISKAAIIAWRYLFGNATDKLEIFQPCIRDVLLPQVMSQLINQPFPETRPMLYELLTALIDQYLFAIEVFFTSEKHRALLVDPISESASSAFYAKFEFAKSAYTSHRCLIQRLAGNEYIGLLEAYISGGPFYRPRGSDITVDNASV